MLQKKDKIIDNIQTYFPLLPLIFAIGVIPLIVRIHYYDPKLSGYSWFPDETHLMDMFMYWKNQAMMQLDVILLVGYVYLAWKRQLPKNKIYIPLGIYTVLVVLSTICSVAPTQTWNGFYGMLESTYAAFGYCLICYYASAVIKNEKQLKVVIGALFIGVTILCGIGISQFVGHDFYMTDLGKDLIFPSEYAGYKEYLKLSFGEGRIYASLYNPNYVGVYCCLLLPLFIVLTFSAKKKWQSAICFVLLAMLVVCIVGAKNKTAVLVLIPCMVFIAIYFGKQYWKRIAVTFTMTVLVFIGANMIQGEDNLLKGVLDRVTIDSIDNIGNMTTTQESTQNNIENEENVYYKINAITLNDEDFYITYNNEQLTVKYIHFEDDSWKMEAKDSEGNVIPIIINDEENGYYLEGEKYKGLEFIFGADESMNIGFSVTVNKESYFIYYSEADETYFYTNYYGKRAKIFESETFETPIFELMGGLSGRGEIWSKSVPILKDTLLIGSGPDTYAFMFPQYDYVWLKQNGWETTLITKAHSLYLQTGIQTGVLSLVAFLMFYIGYFIQSCKLYWKRSLLSFSECCGAAIWMGSMCYMLSGITNDSTIGVSIIYWSLLGIGLACNAMIKNVENYA